jgi:ATP-binding cassette, subfamily B (MDR/TAP), member 1
MSKGLNSARTILSLENSIPQETKQKQSLPSLNQLNPEIPLIEFRDANFSYPSRPSLRALRGLSFKIHLGQFIAFVGPSGCGKSTVVQLLERFYDLSSGEILICGIPVQDLHDEDIRSIFALVSQEPTLYAGSIKYNVSLGTGEELSPEKLDRVLDRAQLSDLVTSLPDGVNTQVGPRGTALSGGQKQRVAIARALAQETPILLLDEATSALDSESERQIQQTLISGKDDGVENCTGSTIVPKTVIAVAHRLSTIQHADCIFVLDAGKVVESGRHSELIEKKGVYWTMSRGQAGTN